MPKQQKGKPFPWQISRREAERLQAIEVQYTRLRNKELLAPFIKEFSHLLLVVLASKPYSEWPKEAKMTMEHMTRDWVGAVELYRSLLPKDGGK